MLGAGDCKTLLLFYNCGNHASMVAKAVRACMRACVRGICGDVN